MFPRNPVTAGSGMAFIEIKNVKDVNISTTPIAGNSRRDFVGIVLNNHIFLLKTIKKIFRMRPIRNQ
jgi:hypothetical protein